MTTHSFLVEWRSEDTFAAFVQLGHDDVLGLVGGGLGGEVDDVGLVLVLVQLVQQEVLAVHKQRTSMKTTNKPSTRDQTISAGVLIEHKVIHETHPNVPSPRNQMFSRTLHFLTYKWM